MKQDISKIIRDSTFEIKTGRYIYAKVVELPSPENHFMISQDADEITVITKEENIGSINLIEKNRDFYTLISLNVSVPFYSVGFLAAVSSAMAKSEINVLIVSTYSKDYILVREDCAEKAKNVLLESGIKEKK
jgi:hypothetical protein